MSVPVLETLAAPTTVSSLFYTVQAHVVSIPALRLGASKGMAGVWAEETKIICSGFLLLVSISTNYCVLVYQRERACCDG